MQKKLFALPEDNIKVDPPKPVEVKDADAVSLPAEILEVRRNGNSISARVRCHPINKYAVLASAGLLSGLTFSAQ